MHATWSYKVSFLALTDVLYFEIKTHDEVLINKFIEDLLIIFSKIDIDNEKITVPGLQVNSQIIRSKMEIFAEHYSQLHLSVNKIPAYFRKLKENEQFIFLPNIEIDTTQHLRLFNYLRASNEGKDFLAVQNLSDELFSEVFEKYSLAVYGDKRKLIGNPKKSERVCRFCKNTRVPLTFNSEAHAISEALGNKTVILYDECDGCNADFSKNVEQDIIRYLSLYRTFFGVKGKGGVKQFSGKNFEVTKEDSVIFTVVNNDLKGESLHGQKATLETDAPITRQNIYKTLCKYFLSVIDAKYISHFDKTVEWINGKHSLTKLPKIAQMITYHSFSLQPKLVTYIRTIDDKSIPFAVGEFYFTCMLFVFIVPLSDQDTSEFTGADYENFWKSFPHFKKAQGWTFDDYSSNHKGTFTIHVNFKKVE